MHASTVFQKGKNLLTYRVGPYMFHGGVPPLFAEVLWLGNHISAGHAAFFQPLQTPDSVITPKKLITYKNFLCKPTYRYQRSKLS